MPVRRCWLVCCILLVVCVSTTGAQDAPQLQSPASYLGYELGQQFTPHHRVVDYVRHVAAHSPAVTVHQYGTSHEGRPLLLTTITTPQNQARIDTIRRANLRRAGQVSGSPQADVAVTWLSYNVHGDEPAPTEAALKTLYTLADTSNARVQTHLKETVVLLDPNLNPDGRARYVQWFRQTVGTVATANPHAREHHPPWAPGRTNHYYFDLNRDWTWAVQTETRQRLDVYHRWMPNVHVDYHEMDVDAPYYFAPGAAPYHENLTEWQQAFQDTIGHHNAAAFDRNNWLYFTGEVFDLLYPGYGDTWPLFNGAIGMTYEQGGGNRAGRTVHTPDGDTLTLAERIAHHHTTALSTIAVTAEHHDEVIREFAAYHQSSQTDPPGTYRTYVVHRHHHGDRVAALARLLDRQHIQYRYADEATTATGRAYRSGTSELATIRPGDLIVDTAQPKGRLAKVLFEPQTTLDDSLTYDITAWGLPYAYGVAAHALPDSLSLDTTPSPPSPPNARAPDRPYAYVFPRRSRADLRLVGALLQANVRLRVTTTDVTVNGTTYAAGTLVATRPDNGSRLARFDQTVRRLARTHNQPLQGLSSGLTDEGPDLGSNQVRPLARPHVAMLAGPPLNKIRVGEVWHLFDQTLEYPLTLLPTDDFTASMLSDVDVLVLPGGSYSDWLSDDRATQLTEWVKQGGRLIALGTANTALAPHPPYHLSPTNNGRADTTTLRADTPEYGTSPRARLPHATPGSIHRVHLDPSHPLTYGIEAPYFTLKRNDHAFTLSNGGWAAGTLKEDAPVSGFMGRKARQNVDETMLFGTQQLGDGHVVYLIDNPLFRGFWYNGHLLFSNAVFFVDAR